MKHSIILFDGVCNFCNSSVNFIIKRDPFAHFKFSSLQSDFANELLKEYKLPQTMESIVVVEDNEIYTMSTTALRVARKLKGFWKFLYIFIIVPRPIRDFIYKIIAKNRYRWFGQAELCRIPSPEERERFL